MCITLTFDKQKNKVVFFTCIHDVSLCFSAIQLRNSEPKIVKLCIFTYHNQTDILIQV